MGQDPRQYSRERNKITNTKTRTYRILKHSIEKLYHCWISL